jgi:hypothetical protein
MKKIVALSIVVAISLCIVSCIKYRAHARVEYHYITNTSGKRIAHEVICNHQYVGKDTLRFFSSGETYLAELEWVVSARFPNEREIVEYYWHTYIYCIDDTTSIRWGGLWGEGLSNKTLCNQYFCLIDTDMETTKESIVYTTEFYLTVNDSLLLTMQKDYAMLDKFKAYYEQK